MLLFNQYFPTTVHIYATRRRLSAESATVDDVPSIGTAAVLCRDADKDYAGYIMQDFRQPMGVATYKTADEMDPELLKALPPKEELQKVFEESSKKEETK